MDLQTRLSHKLDEIAAFLLSHNTDNTEIGVLSGISGIALFHFYYAKFRDDDSHAEKGSELITETFSRIDKGYNYPTFCDGIAGACWALELLKEEQCIVLEEDIITPQVDQFLFEKMKKDLKQGKYDFLHGAIGYGYYFLKRYQNITSTIQKERYRDYINVLIAFFKDTAIKSESGIWWQSEIKRGNESFVGCNLGLSHGVSSILNFLSRLAIYSDFKPAVYPLLRPAANHILSCRHTNPIYTSSFPNWITDKNPEGYNSRLAWCYGDLGIGISLLRAGDIIGDTALYNEALYVLKRSTTRRDIEEAAIKDAGVCHGAYGVMHIYHQVYQNTGDILFKENSDFWANTALDMAIYKNGYVGYLFGNDQDKLSDDVLEGIAGVGLAILSMISDINAYWDQALMIS